MKELSPKQREMLGLAVEVLFLIFAIWISSSLWNKRHTTNTVTTKTVVVSASPQASTGSKGATPTPLPASMMETIVIPINSVAPGYKLTMQAPKSWRMVDIRSLMPLSSYSSYNGNDLAALLRFVPEQPERNKLYSSTEPINMLDILATGRWVTENDGDLATPANKKAYLAYLSGLKTVDDIAGTKCTAISMGGSTCTDKKVKPQIIRTADGALSGMAYLTMQTQSVSYDPSVVLELVGTVGGKPMHVAGTFRIYDKLYETLGSNGVNTNTGASDWNSKVTAARKSYSDGDPSADAVEQYGRIVAAVQSMKFGK